MAKLPLCEGAHCTQGYRYSDIFGLPMGNAHAAVMPRKAEQGDESWALASLKCSQSQLMSKCDSGLEISKGLKAEFCSEDRASPWDCIAGPD